jgi:TolB-like protein
MKLRALAGMALAGVLAFVASGCGPLLVSAGDTAVDTVKKFVPTPDLHTHAVESIKQVAMGRIAVMPLIAAPGIAGAAIAPGGPEAITAEVYSQAATAGGWQVVPQDDVEAALAKLPPTTPHNIDENARKLGHMLSVDGVLYGMVERYEEREGLEYAAAKPASVAFELKLLDMKTGQVVWSATYARAQKALSQNFFNVANFFYHRARWVRANEIAQEGVRGAITDLHKRLNFAANVKRFETGTYGQLKSGQQRYSTGPEGLY